MARLIDATRIEQYILNNCSDNEEINAIYAEIVNAPTVDAEPMVRCKDCKWYETEQLKRDGTDDKRYKPSVCVIGAYAEPRKADWYCADGERREDAETN